MTPAIRWGRVAAPGYALALTLLVLAPLLRSGYPLLRDAVSTPRSYLTDAALGLGEASPRAVPQDFLVALASHLIDGGLAVRAMPVAGIWLAGWGSARLAATVLPRAGLPGQFVAITVATWNPYVAERLLQGHWSLLVGYGCLPWVAVAMLQLRCGSGDHRPALFALAFWVALAGLTPTGLILAAVVALAGVASPGVGLSRRLCAVGALAVSAVAALPWLAALVLAPSPGRPGAAGAAAFAARAEPGLGTVASLAGLGGIWNGEAVPWSRTTSFAVVSTLLLVGTVAIGLPVAARRRGAAPLLVLAAVSVLVPAALATGPGLAAVSAMIDAAPPLGVLRDGQKWVALAVPGYALAGAGAVVSLRRRPHPAAAALCCCAAVMLALPDLAWGVGGQIRPVHYPPGWPAVAGIINADPRAVAVLPADGMRRFSWSGPAPVLDPLPRWVRADVLATGDLTVSGQVLPGEGIRAQAVQALLLAGADPGALTDAGVGWVVVQSGTPGETGASGRTLRRLPVLYRDGDLALYRAGGAAPGASAGWRRTSVIAHLVWLAVLVCGAGGMACGRFRHRRSSSVPGHDT